MIPSYHTKYLTWIPLKFSTPAKFFSYINSSAKDELHNGEKKKLFFSMKHFIHREL